MPPLQSQAIQVLKQDAVFAPLLDQFPLPEPAPLQPDLYFDLLESIVSQQLSVKAAATIFARFRNLFADQYPYPELLLVLLPEELRGVGLSGQKAQYLKAVAEYWLEEARSPSDWLVLPDEVILTKLTSIKGVGEWTVQMILMFSLGRPDVFPIGDLGIRDAMIRLYAPDAETPKAQRLQLESIAAAWQPHRTLACRYLWRWRDSILRQPK